MTAQIVEGGRTFAIKAIDLNQVLMDDGQSKLPTDLQRPTARLLSRLVD